MRRLVFSLAVYLFLGLGVGAQQSSVEEELRAELARMKEQIARMESLLERLASERRAESSQPAPAPTPAPTAQVAQAAPRRAPALNTPPQLPLQEERYRKTPPRFDVLLQARGDFFADTSRNDTFFLRKAEIGVKGHITKNVDFVIEVDPVRANDALRRTYIRLSHLKRLHAKLGLEKAPLGLEELTPTAQIPFVDRSEVNDRFAPAEEFGVHLESHWDHALFQFSVSNGSRRISRDENREKDFTGRVVWAPRHWFSIGGAVQSGAFGPTSIVRDRYNAELKFGSNLSGFQSEFYRAQDGNIWSSAFYVASYWAFPMQKEWLTHIQPVFRYEHIGRSDRDALRELRLATFGVSFLFAEHRSKFQVNYLKDLHTGARRDELRAQYQVEF